MTQKAKKRAKRKGAKKAPKKGAKKAAKKEEAAEGSSAEKAPSAASLRASAEEADEALGVTEPTPEAIKRHATETKVETKAEKGAIAVGTADGSLVPVEFKSLTERLEEILGMIGRKDNEGAREGTRGMYMAIHESAPERVKGKTGLLALREAADKLEKIIEHLNA